MASVDPSRDISGLADRTTALVGWTIAWRATSAVATLALGAVLVRQLPTSEYGRYTLVLSVLVYIALLATFGQDQGLLRYLPEVLRRGDRTAAHDLLRKSAIAVIAVWALTSAVVFLLRPVIDDVLHAHVADLLALGTFLLLGGIAAGVLSFALVAIYDMRSQAIATPIAGLLTLALAVIFLRRGAGLPGVLLAGAIDGLRTVNETRGYDAGDRLLLALAELLMTRLRVTDIAARIGDDDFAIILPRTPHEGAERLAERIAGFARPGDEGPPPGAMGPSGFPGTVVRRMG